MGVLLIPFLIPFILVLVNFIIYLQTGKIKMHALLFKALACFSGIIVPLMFLLLFDSAAVNDCCSDTPIFSPAHRMGIYTLIYGSAFSYGIAIFRKNIFAPLLEVLLNMMLILGVVINIVLGYHLMLSEMGFVLTIFGNLPILMLLFIKLDENHKQINLHIASNGIETSGFLGTLALRILKQNQAIKYPILLVLAAPFVILVSLFLMLFGQKPDAMIRAFTDTYKHGFSQLDHECLNVECGGHFLCSVGANGNKSIVKPIRYGERRGAKIICNRQLLVSNAFEDVIQEKLPKTHRFIRKNYNKVGTVIHRYYGIFNLKWVSNSVYILMKPLEWVFLIVLYCVDKNPENRIAKQYMSKEHRVLIADKSN